MLVRVCSHFGRGGDRDGEGDAPSACPAAASPFWFMLFFLLFFFLSLMGDEWPESFPEKALAAPSRASDGGDVDVIQISGHSFRAAEPGVNVPTLCAFVDSEDGQRWRTRSAPGRSSTAEGMARHA